MSAEGQIGSQAGMLVHNSSAVTATRAVEFASGKHTTVTASDTIATGLSNVTAVIVSMSEDPVATDQHVTAVASGGNMVIKTWKATATADTALIAATGFGIDVDWVAFGT
ncbi:MAG: hypothetical protein ACXABY_22785 [Candidatus Thorarchaeota archaeon]|jgi:hypothetical protein